MIPDLPSSLLNRPGLIARVDFFAHHLVLWTTDWDTVRERIRSANGYEVLPCDEEEGLWWVRRVRTGAPVTWLGMVVKEIEDGPRG